MATGNSSLFLCLGACSTCGFSALDSAKIPIFGHPYAVCRVKIALKADFFDKTARSATNS
jgi:hypothetical protein